MRPARPHPRVTRLCPSALPPAVSLTHVEYHLLVHGPGAGCLQFWSRDGGPEDILGEIAWARTHDKEAQAIATRGQQLAAKYLNGEARACYWCDGGKGSRRERRGCGPHEGSYGSVAGLRALTGK